MLADSTAVFTDVVRTLQSHLPAGTAWVPTAASAAVGIVGLVFLARGARLAPALAAVFFLMLGCLVAPLVAHATGLPATPVLVVSATAGLVLGIVLFRLWFALLIAGSVALGAASLYGGQVLFPRLASYQVPGLESTEDGLVVTLPRSTSEAAQQAAWIVVSSGIWKHLQQQQPNLELNLAVVVVGSGLIGLVFALLLPKAARALWAATTGTVLFLPAAYTSAQLHYPPAAAWLAAWGVTVAAVIWSGSVLLNLSDMLGWRKKVPPPPAAAAS